MTSPATASTRSTWRAFGIVVEGGGDVAPLALTPLATDADALADRRGPGAADVPDNINAIDDPAPDLERWVIQTGPDFVPVVTDADGAILSGWQQRGQGRVGLWTVANSFALVLNGQPDRYQQWWSETVSAVARPDRLFRPTVPPLVQVGERTAICGLGEGARVAGPDKSVVTLAVDPAAGARGCAAYWPSAPGVHTIVQPGGDGDQIFAFLVLPEAVLKAITARETGEATALWASQQNAPDARRLVERRGPAWPYFLGWLLVTGALWFGERRVRAGRASPFQP